MTNKEIEEYLKDWVVHMKAAKDKDLQLLGSSIGITLMLAEIAKRLPEPK
jgi:hypothetical protein